MTWMINTTQVVGPTQVSYRSLETIGQQLDQFPIRQGEQGYELIEDVPTLTGRVVGMEWQYTLLPVDDLKTIIGLSRLNVTVTWFDKDGTWRTGKWHMFSPQVSRRQGMLCFGISVMFRPVIFGTRSVFAVQAGATPSLHFDWASYEAPSDD
jgi:hypothetical protein